jgi:5-methylcytosine-specific restriction protein B
MRPPLSRIERACDALAAADLGRSSANLVRWMAIKWVGAQPDENAVVLTSPIVIDFCDQYFGVPGVEPNRWYDPFTRHWPKNSSNGGWPIGSVLTQIQRPNTKLKSLLRTKETRADDRAAVEVQLPTEEPYLLLLAELLGGKQVPLVDLAIWRYRFGVPAELDGPNVKEAELAVALATELHLSGRERRALFTEDQGLFTEDESFWATEDWADRALVAILPNPAPPQPVEVPAPEPATQDPRTEDEDYTALRAFALWPLESADVDALVGRVETAASQRGLLLPDPELTEQCVLALLTGHIVLQGPPGTGKTTLARALAEAFDCSSDLQTATADWSTYDVIGGLQPSVGDDGREVLRPWLGHVPTAALRCAQTARRHAQEPNKHTDQGHWLIIDEFSRAQIDKAIGGLYTMLGGSGEQALELWFENNPGRKVVPIPNRFRIIATMNDVDASFVYDFSQGLSRRFQFIYVGVPPIEALDDELEAALSHVTVWFAAQYPVQAGTRDHVALKTRLDANPRITQVLALLKDVVTQMRYPSAGAAGGGWPLGTAQLGDVLRRVVLRESAGGDLLPVLDAALADRVVPQLNGAKPVILQTLLGWLQAEHPLTLARTIRAAEHLRDTSATA